MKVWIRSFKEMRDRDRERGREAFRRAESLSREHAFMHVAHASNIQW